MSTLEDQTGTEGLITGKWYILQIGGRGDSGPVIVSGPYDDRAAATQNSNPVKQDMVRRWKGRFWRAG